MILLPDVRHPFAYDFAVSKTGNTLVIAASLIAAIKLPKEERSGSSPNAKSIVASSVNFA